MRTQLLAMLLLSLAGLPGMAALAQEPQVTGDQDGSSQQVEESDEAYRRRMELEDARYRDPTYTDPSNTYRKDAEKIDKLPQESRDNIRDQLVDIIMAKPEWEPGDALEEYPYEPTETAKTDPELMQQEQEAWDEQIEKYHAREAEAFGAYRGPVAGPGNPQGKEGGQQGQQGQEGQQGQDGQQGQQGQNGQQGQEGQQGGQEGEKRDSTAGTYQPQSSSNEDAVSTEGVSESALDFLMNRQAGGQQGQNPGQNASQQQASSGAQQSSPGQAQDSARQQAGTGPQSQDSSAQQQTGENAQQQSQDAAQQQEQAAQQQAQDSAQQAQSEDAAEPDEVTEPDMRGIIAIEDLDKLEGTGAGRVPVPPPEEEEEESEDGGL